MFMGMLTFSDREWLRPGECTEANGSFVAMPIDKPLFVPGFSWDLCEGPCVVGRAELLERTDTPNIQDAALHKGNTEQVFAADRPKTGSG